MEVFVLSFGGRQGQTTAPVEIWSKIQSSFLESQLYLFYFKSKNNVLEKLGKFFTVDNSSYLFGDVPS